jgi:hypothetical protein
MKEDHMGMDVIGIRPTGAKGRRFRNNIWGWRPLADYICEVAPDIAQHCRSWHTNDGDGLDADRALQLADRLQAELGSGRTAHYAQIRASRLEAVPNEPCDICHGTGARTDGNQCPACGGTGYVRPWETVYPFAVENVAEFIAFLRACGGFQIY